MPIKFYQLLYFPKQLEGGLERYASDMFNMVTTSTILHLSSVVYSTELVMHALLQMITGARSCIDSYI